MRTLTREQYDRRLDWLTDSSGLTGRALDEALESFKGGAVRESAPRPAATAKPAATFTPGQFLALMAVVDERRAEQARVTEAAQVREKHARSIATVLTAVARPASLTQRDLATIMVEAGGAGLRSPFYETGPAAAAPPPAAPPPAAPPPMSLSARELAALPLSEFRAVAASELAAETQAGGHRSPFYRTAASR
jgi:hypothetical protein